MYLEKMAAQIVYPNWLDRLGGSRAARAVNQKFLGISLAIEQRAPLRGGKNCGHLLSVSARMCFQGKNKKKGFILAGPGLGLFGRFRVSSCWGRRWMMGGHFMPNFRESIFSNVCGPGISTNEPPDRHPLILPGNPYPKRYLFF